MNKYPNITQKKTAEINRLKTEVTAATRKTETSRAALEAAIIKSELYGGLLVNAQARLNTATEELYQSSRAAQNLESLEQSDKMAVEVVNETRERINTLIAQVQAVANTTLNAASSISEMSRLIIDRKASNPLISSELVNRAQAALEASNRTVTLIINTLTSVTNALSTAGQAADTAKIVEAEIEALKLKLVEGSNGLADKTPIKPRVEQKYNKMRYVENETQQGAKQAKDQQLASQDNLIVATNQLQKAQAALSAAEAAIGSN